MDRFVSSSGKKSGGKAKKSHKPSSTMAEEDDGGVPQTLASNSTRPSDPGTIDTDAQPAATVAVVLSRSTESATSSGKSSATAPVKVAVAVRTPRKRTGPGDQIRYSLQHYAFLDDRRRFTNLDALLTRLGRVECVHVSCTENAEVRNLNLHT